METIIYFNKNKKQINYKNVQTMGTRKNQIMSRQNSIDRDNCKAPDTIRQQ